MLKIILGIISLGAIGIALIALLFTSIAVLVPTSADYQYEEWKSTVVNMFGLKVTQLTAIRLQIAGIGLCVILPFAGIAWFSLQRLIKL
jgi:hypothetical protein